MALSAAFSMTMIITGVANTGGSIASLNRFARCSGCTSSEKEPLAPRDICFMACAPAGSIDLGEFQVHSYPGRRREAADLIGEQTRELDGRRVFAFRPDDLPSDR